MPYMKDLRPSTVAFILANVDLDDETYMDLYACLLRYWGDRHSVDAAILSETEE